MLAHVLDEFRRARIERTPGAAGVDRHLELVGEFLQAGEPIAMLPVLPSHLLDWRTAACSAAGEQQGKEDLLLHVHVVIQFQAQALEFVGQATRGVRMIPVHRLDLAREADQFRRFIGILDTCTLPTVVCAGNHDRQGDNYERFFGPLTSRFTFGSDGYLVFDTKDFDTADGATAQDGLLHRFRRELKPCRWTFGLTHRYEPAMGMRAQLTLFVDDPLDGLFFGHIHRELREGENIPWGRTAAWAVPAAVDGRYRMVDVTRQGPMPRAAARAGGETEKAE